MGLTKKRRDEIWSNVPQLLSKEEILEIGKVINEIYNKVYKK